jgi:hypothetical protein
MVPAQRVQLPGAKLPFAALKDDTTGDAPTEHHVDTRRGVGRTHSA